jgi:hypothetical protein
MMRFTFDRRARESRADASSAYAGDSGDMDLQVADDVAAGLMILGKEGAQRKLQ